MPTDLRKLQDQRHRKVIHTKVPGKLIQDCGLKGFRVGDAVVSEKHSGFVINAGQATAADVMALIRYVQQEVEEKFHVRIEPEVRLLGEF